MRHAFTLVASFFIAFPVFLVGEDLDKGGIFTGAATVAIGSGYNTATARTVTSSEIFQKHLGAANPVQWGRKLTGNISRNFVETFPAWNAAKRDMLNFFGSDAQVKQYVEYQEYLMRKSVAKANFSGAKSSAIKGEVAESFMDSFYKKDGWESVPGKRGSNGFDGLYVKRWKQGVIVDYLAVDAKSGSAKLGMTNRGKQLSTEWVRANLQDLLANAKENYASNPTPENRRRIADCEQMLRIKGREPRVLSQKISQQGGVVGFEIAQTKANGSMTGKPMFVDLQSPKVGRIMTTARNGYYSSIEKAWLNAGVAPKQAQQNVLKLQRAFERGRVGRDDDLYRFNQRLAKKEVVTRVNESLGKVPPRGTLAGHIGYQRALSLHGGTGISAATAAGMIVARDMLNGNFSMATVKDAAYASAIAGGGFYVVEYGSRFAIQSSGKYVTKGLAKVGVKVATKTVSKTLGKVIPVVNIVAVVGFAAWDGGWAVSNFNSGLITQREMLERVSLATGGSAVFIVFTAWGAAIGTGVCPGGGTVVGALIGSVVGGVVDGGTYLWYEFRVATRLREKIEKESQMMAEWAAAERVKRFRERIKELETSADQRRKEAWKVLL